ncbi:MAG TPA: helicase-exonuclease AddAB subunit AddA [Phycisphaerae bacterium]|nr:helicase-exonuclease AddAB subunit AddA [Phycisphaerae bacterium]
MSVTEKTDRFAHLTAAQREAIRTTDCSLLVSAAAGSGKTTVLAERCAYLVCDLPAEQRCGVGELLVVTFTDAAAGEMRSRIGAAIRQRIKERPTDAYLREQLYLLDSASISTIHSFCRTIVQKWFPQAGIDPQAALLSGDEAELLRREVLDELLQELYGREDELGAAFRALVDEYGAGEDWQIGEVVLSVHDFINSLPDPYGWLDRSVRQFDPSDDRSVVARLDELQAQRLRDELARQTEFAAQVVRTIEQLWPTAVSRLAAAQAHRDNLIAWSDRLARDPADWEGVATAIREFRFDRLASKPRKLSEADSEAYDRAKELYDQAKALFGKRLQEKLCRFTAAEYRDGLRRTAPFVATMVDLVRQFDRRYSEAKNAQAALDFNDLQRGALRILADNGDASRPSLIARQLQRQYRYVLVDEFQDVDPLQESILRLVSRETADPPCGNFFTVGDIKQSIYRFRLAEPRLFMKRADEFGEPGAIGRVIHLQENFRSRQGIIETVNEVFRCLMSREFGGSEYDTHAELHAGATYPDASDGATFGKPAIELHLLEPVTQQTKSLDEADDNGEANDGDDAELEGIEREAFLIAGRIRDWMGLQGGGRRQVAAKPESPGLPPATRPIEYGDIVILLRAMPHKAEPIAEVLRRMGIPVRIEGADNQLDSTEFRDVYSLLQVLDNRQQDIPLAAVLRSPLLGDPLNEQDLLEIRLVDKSVAFHAAVEMYRIRGKDDALRKRLTVILDRLERLRTRIQREPVADVLWDVYEETSYLSFVAGLPDGVQRRNRLVRLHELARQFGRFSRQGLRRFLRFLDEMVEQERGGPPAAAGSAGENAVRIMTIHASKGLEFPVVILADLQKRFNLADTHEMALVDRELGLALQVADAERRVRYPTFLHQLAAERGRQESLSEELRVLYVALTRAREHLVLVGRCPLSHIEAACRRAATGGESRVPRMLLESAGSVLEWLLPALGRMPVGTVEWGEGPVDASRAPITVRVYERSETDEWRVPPAQRPETADALAAVGRLEPLSSDEPVARTPVVEEILSALSFEYPGLELTTLPARTAVSEIKRTWQADIDPDERPASRRHRPLPRPVFLDEGPSDLTAAARGLALHRFMQLLDLHRPCDADDLERQLHALVEAGRMCRADAEAVDLAGAVWFFTTPLGRSVRKQADRVLREVAFVSRVAPERLDPLVHGRDPRDVVLVRGIVDLVIRRETDLLILDYKTDDIPEDQCAARAEHYRTQLAHYAEALGAAYRRSVGGQYLVFLSPRQIVELTAS